MSSVLNRMERNRQSLKSLKASLSMEKYNAQLRDKDQYSGWVMSVPARQRSRTPPFVSNGRNRNMRFWPLQTASTRLYRPRLNQVLRANQIGSTKGAAAGGVLDMMYMSKQQLEAKFQPVQDVREETLWGGISTIHLTLVPKGNAGYKYAEIWVDSGGMPVQTKIVEKNGDATTMRSEWHGTEREDFAGRV